MDRFVAAFDARVDAGTAVPADGYSFNWATDLPAGTYGTAEEGAGGGLTIAFDIYDGVDANPNNGVGEAPDITIKWKGLVVTNRLVPLSVMRTADGTFEEVLVRLETDGTVDVAYNGEVIFQNVLLPNFAPLAGAKFGFAGRTGGANQNHWIDNICIQTFESVAPPVITQQPADQVTLAGTTAELSVRVSDPLAIASYQWQQKGPGAANFSNIAGATTNDFTTPPLTVASNGIQYQAVLALTSGGQSLTSRVATVQVLDIPIPTPTVSYDFNDGTLPAGALVFGNAVVEATGGVNDSGVIKLTINVNGQVGSFIVNDVAGSNRVNAMTAAFKTLIGGGTATPADGMSFVWGDLPDGAFGEDGGGSGLVISFDTYDNTDGNPNNGVGEAPAIELRWLGESVATNRVALSLLQTEGQFVDVIVRVEADGTVDVVYDNEIIFHNVRLPNYNGIVGARFGWGGRTGGLNDNHWIDDLKIAVGTQSTLRVSIARSGNNVIVTYDGVLQSASTVNGTYTDVAGAANPYTTSATGSQRYFRSRAP